MTSPLHPGCRPLGLQDWLEEKKIPHVGWGISPLLINESVVGLSENKGLLLRNCWHSICLLFGERGEWSNNMSSLLFLLEVLCSLALSVVTWSLGSSKV